MSEITPKLSLPYILPSQAQKHVTHNEALQRLDAIVQLVVLDERASPPQDKQEGDCYLVAVDADDPWLGKAGQLAIWQDASWLYIVPRDGWHAWFADTQRLKVLTDTHWMDMPTTDFGSLQRLGIGATPDGETRFAVSSPASLFDNAGNGHQLKINKAASPDTASLLFQTNWSGRAEMGLAGNDEFSIKVSDDGTTWATGLSISASGRVSIPNRPVLRAGLAAGTLTPADGSATGFSTLDINQGGFALGNAVPGGSGQEIIVPVTGLYLLNVNIAINSSSGHTVSIRVNGTVTSSSIVGTANSANSQQSACFILALNADDRVTFGYGGTVQLAFGPGKTELHMVML